MVKTKFANLRNVMAKAKSPSKTKITENNSTDVLENLKCV